MLCSYLLLLVQEVFAAFVFCWVCCWRFDCYCNLFCWVCSSSSDLLNETDYAGDADFQSAAESLTGKT